MLKNQNSNERAKAVADSYINEGAKYFNQAMANPHSQNELLNKSLEFFSKSLSITKIFDTAETDLITGQAYAGIGTVLHANQNYNQALDMYKKSLSIREANFGNESRIETIELLKAMGMCAHELGALDKSMYNESIKYFTKQLGLVKKTNEKANKIEISFIFHNIAASYEKLEDHQNSLEFQKGALKIRQELYESAKKSAIENPDEFAQYADLYADSLRHVGAALHRLEGSENYLASIEKFKEALAIREELPNHTNYKSSLTTLFKDLSITYYRIGDTENALFYNVAWLNSNLINLPEDKKSMEFKADILDAIADLYTKNNKYQEGWEKYTEALNLRIKFEINSKLENSIMKLESLASQFNNKIESDCYSEILMNLLIDPESNFLDETSCYHEVLKDHNSKDLDVCSFDSLITKSDIL